MKDNTRIPSVDHASHRLVLSVTVIHRKIALRKLKLCKPRLFPLLGTIFVPQSLRWLKHTDPFSVPFKSLIKQWLFLYLHYKTNSSSATKTPKEEDVTLAQIKCQKFHAKPVEITSLVLTKATFLIPWFQSMKQRHPAVSLTPQGPRYVICHLLVL